jgi:hypothetical protein
MEKKAETQNNHNAVGSSAADVSVQPQAQAPAPHQKPELHSSKRGTFNAEQLRVGDTEHAEHGGAPFAVHQKQRCCRTHDQRAKSLPCDREFVGFEQKQLRK